MRPVIIHIRGGTKVKNQKQKNPSSVPVRPVPCAGILSHPSQAIPSVLGEKKKTKKPFPPHKKLPQCIQCVVGFDNDSVPDAISAWPYLLVLPKGIKAKTAFKRKRNPKRNPTPLMFAFVCMCSPNGKKKIDDGVDDNDDDGASLGFWGGGGEEEKKTSADK